MGQMRVYSSKGPWRMVESGLGKPRSGQCSTYVLFLKDLPSIRATKVQVAQVRYLRSCVKSVHRSNIVHRAPQRDARTPLDSVVAPLTLSADFAFPLHDMLFVSLEKRPSTCGNSSLSTDLAVINTESVPTLWMRYGLDSRSMDTGNRLK